MYVPITKDQIDAIFKEVDESAEPHQAEILIKLYRLVYPDWNVISKIRGWPRVNRNTWKYIFSKFQDFDCKHHPEVMKGGLWFNNGFSRNDEHGEPNTILPEWVIDKSGIQVEYFKSAV